MKGCHSKAEIFLALFLHRLPFYVNYDVSEQEEQIQQIHKQMYIFQVYITQVVCRMKCMNVQYA